MFGLTCDFIQRDGICMVLDEPGGLPAGKLNRVQVRMMVNSSIPNHLRLYLKEIDLKVTLEYAVTDKKMLSHLLKTEKLTMNSFFGLLLQVAQAMEEGKLYMLEPELYALHEDYIFIEGSLQNGKVYLTYIPWSSPTSAVKPGESLRSLIMVMMAAITELNGDGVQRLLHYCGESGFTSAGLKGLLSELLTAGSQPSKSLKVQAVEEQSNYGKTLERPESQWGNGERPLPPEEKKEISSWMNGYSSIRSRENDSGISNSSSETSDTETQPSNSRIYIGLGCFLGDALLWKFLYLNNPKPIGLIICCVATVVLAVVSAMAWRGVFNLGGGEEDGYGDEEEEEDHTPHNIERPPHSLSRPLANIRKLELVQREPFSRENSEIQQLEKAPPAILPTALLSPEKVPVNGQELGKRQQELPYLERCDKDEQGIAEKIELNRPSFIIGRSTDVAQYIERSTGASRVHAEISRCSGGYILKDLNSRNGTFLQGEAMIPYKEYRLAEGDVFTIVKGSYTFRSA